MTSFDILRLAIISLVVIIIQVMVLSPISLFGVAIPHLYPIVLLMLPIQVRPISLLWVGFIVGSVLDWFLLTPGLHAAALTFASFLRYYFLRPMVDRQVKEESLPTLATLGSSVYVLMGELLFVHHLVLYALDMGIHFDGWGVVVCFVVGLCVSYLLCIIAMMCMSIRTTPR